MTSEMYPSEPELCEKCGDRPRWPGHRLCPDCLVGLGPGRAQRMYPPPQTVFSEELFDLARLRTELPRTEQGIEELAKNLYAYDHRPGPGEASAAIEKSVQLANIYGTSLDIVLLSRKKIVVGIPERLTNYLKGKGFGDSWIKWIMSGIDIAATEEKKKVERYESSLANLVHSVDPLLQRVIEEMQREKEAQKR